MIAASSVHTEIHCFSDASEKAYGTCVYFHSTDGNGEITVQLLTSKSKVAPLKVQSLPRLELCGAVLAAQLMEMVLEALTGQYKVHFWTDSTCVLQWIRATPPTWNTFVANRVSKIQTLTEGCSWRHVPGISNPADLISRGVMPNALEGNSLWWEGPGWLKEGTDNWPKLVSIALEDAPEQRRSFFEPQYTGFALLGFCSV